MKTPLVRTRFNVNMDELSEMTGLSCGEPSKTQQNMKEETDINTIVRRFGLTGQLPQNPRPPQYGDFTQVADYQTALNAVRAAGEAFMEFPAHLRARFANDPQQMLEFLADPGNHDEAANLGLVNRKVLPDPPVPDPPVDQSST